MENRRLLVKEPNNIIKGDNEMADLCLLDRIFFIAKKDISTKTQK